MKKTQFNLLTILLSIISLFTFNNKSLGQNEGKEVKESFYDFKAISIEGEEVSMEEGCLSLPGIHESVKRMNRIHVKYMDENFVEHDEWVEGYLARVMQHEFDHLNGIMFIDHISPLRKQMIKGKLNAMLKGKARCSYKVKTVK